MIDLMFSPKWFYGKDIAIDLVAIIILTFIAFYSIRCYRLNKKNKNYLSFAASFLLLALSFLFKILTNFTLYYYSVETRNLGFITVSYNALRSSDILFFIGSIMYRALMLFGLYVLYSVYQKQSSSNIFIIFYLLVISVYFSRSVYFIFHLTSLIFLVFITYSYYQNYVRSRNNFTKYLFASFAIITLSEVFAIFVKLNLVLYAVAEIVQLIGYVCLLAVFVMVLKNVKKKG